MANSIAANSTDITPSFQNTNVPVAQAHASGGGGPMTFEPNSFAGRNSAQAAAENMSFN